MKSDAEIWGLPSWYLQVFRALTVEVFLLVTLGAAVRVMNAGLACPDWPLCFGDFIPDYHPQVYFEFIHRALAGLVAILTFVLVYILVFRSTAPRQLKAWGVVSVLLLLVQIVMGGLTVLMKLDSHVVAAHLTMGTGFFAILTWILLHLRGGVVLEGLKHAGKRLGDAKSKVQEIAKPFMRPSKMLLTVSFLMFLAVYVQIILGGLVASHYAALVCIDFPKCHGEWFPTFRGIIGLHVIHRLGAYTVMALALAHWFYMRKQSQSLQVHKLAMWILLLVFVQAGIGIANVLYLTPALLAVAHLAVATLILGLTVRSFYWTSRA